MVSHRRLPQGTVSTQTVRSLRGTCRVGFVRGEWPRVGESCSWARVENAVSPRPCLADPLPRHCPVDASQRPLLLPGPRRQAARAGGGPGALVLYKQRLKFEDFHFQTLKEYILSLCVRESGRARAGTGLQPL